MWVFSFIWLIPLNVHSMFQLLAEAYLNANLFRHQLLCQDDSAKDTLETSNELTAVNKEDKEVTEVKICACFSGSLQVLCVAAVTCEQVARLPGCLAGGMLLDNKLLSYHCQVKISCSTHPYTHTHTFWSKMSNLLFSTTRHPISECSSRPATNTSVFVWHQMRNVAFRNPLVHRRVKQAVRVTVLCFSLMKSGFYNTHVPFKSQTLWISEAVDTFCSWYSEPAC